MRFLGLFLPLFLLTGCGSSITGHSSEGVSSNGSAPVAASSAAVLAPNSESDVRLSIVSFDDIQKRIAGQRGKVVVMDAWSTSCPPCLSEFHNLVELDKKYGRDELACMSLSFDYEGIGKPQEQIDAVITFLRSQNATFDNMLSSEESDVLYQKFKLASVPAVFVYDRSGVLRKRFDNERAKSKAEAFTYAQVGELVAQLLSEKAPLSDDSQRP